MHSAARAAQECTLAAADSSSASVQEVSLALLGCARCRSQVRPGGWLRASRCLRDDQAKEMKGCARLAAAAAYPTPTKDDNCKSGLPTTTNYFTSFEGRAPQGAGAPRAGAPRAALVFQSRALESCLEALGAGAPRARRLASAEFLGRVQHVASFFRGMNNAPGTKSG